MHLVPEQTYAFELYSQGYEWYYSFGMSMSAGVGIGVKHSNRVISYKISKISGRLVAIDVVTDDRTIRIINIYAPNNNHERSEFFRQIPKHLNSNCILMGDFNSVTAKEDCKSQNLDATSVQLNDMLLVNEFEEINGSHRDMYTYHHPSIPAKGADSGSN